MTKQEAKDKAAQTLFGEAQYKDWDDLVSNMFRINTPFCLEIRVDWAMDLFLEQYIKESQTEKENQELRKMLQIYSDEKEAAIYTFTEIRKIFQGRKWVTEGRGNYPYDDDRYKEEVRYILDEFNELNSSFWKQIKTKTFEYRQMIEEPLLNKIKELEAQLESSKLK